MSRAMSAAVLPCASRSATSAPPANSASAAASRPAVAASISAVVPLRSAPSTATPRKQLADHRRMAAMRGRMQRGAAGIVGGMRIGAFVQQTPDERGVASASQAQQPLLAAFRSQSRIRHGGAAGIQQAHQLDLAGFDGHAQRALSDVVALFRAGAMREQAAHDGGMSGALVAVSVRVPRLRDRCNEGSSQSAHSAIQAGAQERTPASRHGRGRGIPACPVSSAFRRTRGFSGRTL